MKWNCTNKIVCIPKYRRKIMYLINERGFSRKSTLILFDRHLEYRNKGGECHF